MTIIGGTMIRPFVFTVAMLVCASIAMAQGIGLYAGSDCSGPSNVTNACTTNTGTAFMLFGTCVVPPPGLSSVVGARCDIDIQTALATIPDWWRLDANACRSTALSVKTDATIVGAACSHSLWDGIATVNSVGYAELRFNRMHLMVGGFVTPDEVFNLAGDGTTELAVFSLSVLNTKTVGSGSCAGCGQGACIVLNKISFDTSGQDNALLLTTPIAGHNYITYNGGSPNCPASTPTANRTWGELKSLYH
jgi:hypothetical protein